MPPMIRRLLTALAVVCSAVSAQANTLCELEGALASLYQHSERAIADAGSESRARAVEERLAALDTSDLFSRLQRAGLENHEAQIRAFLSAGHELLATLRADGARSRSGSGIPDAYRKSARQMQKLLAQIACNKDDQAFAPQSHASRISQSGEIDGKRAHRQNSRGGFQSRALSIAEFSYILLGATLLSVGLAVLITRHRRRKMRRARRYNCNIGCAIDLSGASTPGCMVDISRIGAKIKSPLGPNGKSPCSVRVGEREYHGHVAWSNAHYFGVEFSPAITQDGLTALLRGRAG